MHYAAPSAQDPFCAGKSSEAWDVGVEGTQEVLETEKHYQAVLQVCSADEEFRLKEQWVVFRISPRNAMVRVDSTLVSTRNGEASFYLPLGKHPYKVESPFIGLSRIRSVWMRLPARSLNWNFNPFIRI